MTLQDPLVTLQDPGPWGKTLMKGGARNTSFRAKAWRAATGDTYHLVCLFFLEGLLFLFYL